LLQYGNEPFPILSERFFIFVRNVSQLCCAERRVYKLTLWLADFFLFFYAVLVARSVKKGEKYGR
jgi:uncharacterized membrane protein YjgN (DUF898 family)